jgi:hypothetical protein
MMYPNSVGPVAVVIRESRRGLGHCGLGDGAFFAMASIVIPRSVASVTSALSEYLAGVYGDGRRED